MKLLYLVHQFYPMHYTGTEKFVLNIANMMQKVGHKSKVVTYSFYDESFYDQRMGNILIKEFTYKGLPVIAVRHKNIPIEIGAMLNDGELSRVTENILKRESPDIIHVGHPMRVSEFIKAAIRLGLPYVLTLTDFWLICHRGILLKANGDLCGGPQRGRLCKQHCPDLPGPKIEQRLSDARDILLKAERIISPSLFLASVFKNEMPNLDIRIINHGLRYSVLKQNRGNGYIKGNSIVFCYAGSLGHHKGVHVLLNAFRRLDASNCLLKIYGSGSDELYIQNLKSVAGNDRRIEFCGVFSEEQVGNILSAIDMVIIPSLWFENYPLILHEALACNVPVVASNVGGMAEKIKDGLNGYTFKVGDSDHLREILAGIVENPSVLNTLKDNIRNIVVPTIEQEAYTYEREYKSELIVKKANARVEKDIKRY